MSNTTPSFSQYVRPLAALCALVAALGLSACGKVEEGTQLGKGGSVVTGSAGPQGAQNASKQLQTCESPIAVVSLAENERGYVGIGSNGLPSSPLPLVRVMMQQSGCFRIVDRNSGLRGTIKEQELKDQGILKGDAPGNVKKGQGIMAQYTVVPNLTFSEQDAGRNIGGVLTSVGLDKAAGLAGQVKFKEAQVVLLLTDNETTEQLAAATGAARTTDLGLGGLAFGKAGAGLGGLGWSNTNEAKVIAAAFLDAHNNLVQQARTLQAKTMPEPVAVKKK